MKVVITEKQFEEAKKNGVTKTNLKSRVHYQGFSIEEAINLPLGKHRRSVGKEELFTQEEILKARENNVSKYCLRVRVNSLGYTKEEAINLPLGVRRTTLGAGV